ncbi:class I SAM-dependent methyltransferase [Kitasatospora kifunensis]|uniref:SAM-dependent methyltransferase n=1 Tax=Kitasatospora kifunensis TaxID=58351 RepID=A0A7W7RBC6_KITKI|nr:class I SAM-dependent methyltransferase [Kitasatospora kifunensis]MBB4928730.1 SAM-dependent methyltransferase [Kitasatospora kifunensis]
MTDTSGADYAVSVEFYDLLQAEARRDQATRRFTEAARRARHGVLDIGAGTGIVTEVLLDACAVPIHVVEPTPAMRAALLTRLAALGADRRARVTLHSAPVEAAGLEGVADLAVASNVIACLDPATRRAVWQAVARALLPGGLLLFDLPPAQLPTSRETVGRLGPVRVGPDIYTAEVTREPDRGIVRVVFTYCVLRDGQVVRRATEAFSMWPAGARQLGAELEAQGLYVVRAPSVGLMAARRRWRAFGS